MKIGLLLLGILCMTLSAKAQLPVMVQDIYPGSKSANPKNLFAWNGSLYFYAADSLHGMELWHYNETTPASLVADINPGNPGILGGQFEKEIVVFKNIFYFVVAASTGNILYKYDGVNPPVPATNFSPTLSINSAQSVLTVAGSKLYFVGSDTPGKFFVCAYDGISAPQKIAIPGLGTMSNDPLGLTEFKGKLYFSAGITNKLYSLDPATNNVSMVTTAAYPSGLSNNIRMVVVGTKMYFQSQSDSAGQELYSYDGTTAARLTDVAPGTTRGIFKPIVAYNGRIYFSGSTDGTNFQLYTLDTQSAYASLAAIVNPAGNAGILDMIAYKSKLYFIATTPTAGTELWSYNGSTALLVTDLNPGTANGIQPGALNLNNGLFAILNGHLYFNGNDGVHGNELFRLDEPTGIQSANWNGEITLHPNPATTSATLSIILQSAQSLHITLNDMAGGTVVSAGIKTYAPGKHDVVLPMQNLATGVYFYRISTPAGNVLNSGTVVKE